MSEINEEPGNTIEHAANIAFDAVKDYLSERGANVNLMYVAIFAGGLEEEQDSVVAATGDELPEEDLRDRAYALLSFLFQELEATARSVGLMIKMIPVKKTGRG